MNDQHRKMLQRLLSDPAWSGFEAFVDEFMLRTFAQASIKRESEFETVWYAAEHEGGKRILQQFINELEAEAGKVDIS